ncbi:jg19236 [Pararge aegeria aegeria]|uniref:Jg19236 protein n=1 Tax=Pararge aegeria aegeria TaxID=348720 RepID=A0A8S4R371_9NEOP|nr:jg19236 [Pararge aegeria aegeria]
MQMGKQGFFMMNSSFKKPPYRKCTWIRPNSYTRNKFNFIMSLDSLSSLQMRLTTRVSIKRYQNRRRAPCNILTLKKLNIPIERKIGSNVIARDLLDQAS